jgi:hypothetical protein
MGTYLFGLLYDRMNLFRFDLWLKFIPIWDGQSFSLGGNLKVIAIVYPSVNFKV